MKSWWQQSSLLCHSQLFLDIDYVFQKTLYLCERSCWRWKEHCVTPSRASRRPANRERVLLSFQHQSSDTFDRISLYAMDTVLVLFPFGPTCIVNHCQVHKKAKTHEPWLVAAHCFMTFPGVLRVAPFSGWCSSSIFSEGVMSPVLCLVLMLYRLMVRYNDRPWNRETLLSHLLKCVC